MNYSRIYETLIAHAQARVRPEGYVEYHHIVPRCMGGGNEKANLVALTAREHYVAHLLLAKVYGGKLWTASKIMGSISGRQKSKMYQVARIKHKSRMRIVMKGENGRKGGLVSKEKGVGIFSATREERVARSKKSGAASVVVQRKLGIGLFGLTKEQRIANGLKLKERGKGFNRYSVEERIAVGKSCVERKTGIFNYSKDQLSEQGKKGGRLGGVKGSAKTNSRRYKCESCGKVSTIGPITHHQNKTGHNGLVQVL